MKVDKGKEKLRVDVGQPTKEKNEKLLSLTLTTV